MLALDKTKFWAVALFIVMAVVWFLLAPSLYAQTLSNDRVGLNRYVRGLVNEPSTTYLPDSTLNRILHFSHRETQKALGMYTAVDIDTIICTRGRHRYALSDFDGNAMVGRVAGVMRRKETDQGGGNVGFQQIEFARVGKIGEGVIPNSFVVEGDHIVIGTTPSGGDTLFVYYMPLANELDEDTSAVTLATEDVELVAMLAAAKVYARDLQLNAAQFYFQMWQQAVALKRREVQVQGQ